MARESLLRAIKKYDKENTKQFKIKLNLNTDKDIIEKLGEVDNIQGYIKRLIRKDIALQVIKDEIEANLKSTD